MAIRANGQVARFFSEDPFNAPAEFEGTFTFSASLPIAAIAVRGYVNEVGLFLMPQVPIAEPGTAGSHTSLVPYFADGFVSQANCTDNQFALPFSSCRFDGTGVMSTELVLVNPSDTAIAGTFTFLSQGGSNVAGSPMNVRMGNETNSTFSYSIPARSARRFETTPASAPTMQGSIQIASASTSELPFAFAVVTGRTNISGANAKTEYQTTIVGQRPASAWRILLRAGLCCGSTPTFQTATTLVITNPANIPIAVNVDLLDADEVPVVMTIPARGQIRLTPSQLPAVGAGYGGMVRISASSPLSVVGFQTFVFRPQLGALAVEAFDEATTPTGPQFVVPHLVTGNYDSTLIIFRTSESQAATATIRFFDPAGLPLDPRDVGLQR